MVQSPPVHDQVVERSGSPLGSTDESLESDLENCHISLAPKISKGGSPSLFKSRLHQKADAASPGGLPPNSTPVKTPSRGPPPASSSAHKRQALLGTVSFYNSASRCRSPALNIISPSHGRTLVEHQPGEHMPYEEWWRKMQRENATPSRNNEWMLGSQGTKLKTEVTGQKLDFSDGNKSAASSSSLRCKFLQKPLEELANDKARHCRLLIISPSVSPATLRNQISKLPGAPEGVEGLARDELVSVYVDLAHAQLLNTPPSSSSAAAAEEEEEANAPVPS